MLDTHTRPTDRNAALTLDALQIALADYQPRRFAFRLWDGTVWRQTPGQPCHFTIFLSNPAALRRMLLPPSEMRIVNAYIQGDFDIEGDMQAAFDMAYDLLGGWGWLDMLQLVLHLLRLPPSADNGTSHMPHLDGQRHSVNRDRQAIQHHYDVSNDFYQLWLDKEMVYSCAYFATPDDDIHTAQWRKLDYICRKLRLQAGDHLLDIGCGWGALIRHAAQHYGVDATGVTISANQFDYARERIAAAGLADRCRVEMLDYRDIDEARPYDAIVSVGMVEHVGRENLPVYFSKVYRLLRPGGVFLNHGISLAEAMFAPDRHMTNSFLTNYIFPDGDLQPIAYSLNAAERAGFEIRDVENLREHYALTLKHWLQRYEAQRQTIITERGPAAYRLWKLYLAAARWLFERGLHGVHQSLLYRIDDTRQTELPLIRADWYNTANQT